MCGDTTTCDVHLRACGALIRTHVAAVACKLSTITKALHMIFVYLRTMLTVAVIIHMDVRSEDPPMSALPSDLAEELDILSENFPTSSQHAVQCSDLSLEPFSCELMYGFPVSLLKLLCKTAGIISRLYLSHNDITGHSADTSLQEDRDRLEEDLLEWPIEDYVRSYQESSISLGNVGILKHNTRAFHQGIIIFFYEKAHSTRARLLQPYVQSVLHNLEQIEEIKTQHSLLSGALLWPAFTAARNATDEAVRRRFISWFEKSDKIGAGTSEAAIKSLYALWGISSPPNRIQSHAADSSRLQVLT